ncbi:hypothetical protein SLS57_006206 [Botryosphaeria dothidea]
MVSMAQNEKLDLFGKPGVSFPFSSDVAEAQKALQATSATGGVHFTEIMAGHIHIGDDIDNLVMAEKVAESSSSSGSLYLSISASGKNSDESVSDGTSLVYNLNLLSTEGLKYGMEGKKNIGSKMAFSITSTWKATTTLDVTLTHPNGSLAGKGILRVSWRNFTSEIRTLSALPNGSFLDRASALTDFVGNFAQNTAANYLKPFQPLQYSPTSPAATITTDGTFSKPPPIHTTELTATDGVRTTLRTWAPTTPTPHARLPILMIPGASVSHAIFALPTVRTNAVDYFTARGHTVHVLSHRFSRTPVCAAGGTSHEARLDVRAALQHLRAQNRGGKIYVIAHCMGAVATAIGLLDGTVPAAWLAGLACTQVFAHLVFGRWNALKAGNPCLPRAYAAVAGSEWFPMEVGEEGAREARVVQGVIDQALRFYPVEKRAEVCRSAVCHRFSLTYGRCWEHANLNRATHERLGELLGGVHMRMLAQTMRMGRVGRLLDGEGRDTFVTEKGLERLRGLPILFVSGGENVVFDPESTFMTYDVLRRRFGPDLYKRKVFQGYGHLDTWMGKDSARDVFPTMGDHLDLCESDRLESISAC